MSARQEWHAVLDDVLEGTHEDLEAIMSSARCFLEGLKHASHKQECSWLKVVLINCMADHNHRPVALYTMSCLPFQTVGHSSVWLFVSCTE